MIDLSVAKQIALASQRSLELRAEAFNVLNHPNKGMPNNTWADPANFGKITYTENAPRVIEFAAKFRF